MSEQFTKEEVKALKRLAQHEIWVDRVFRHDKDGKPIPKGNYSDYVKAMKGAEE